MRLRSRHFVVFLVTTLIALAGCGNATDQQIIGTTTLEPPVVGRQYVFTLAETSTWQKVFAGPTSSKIDPNPDPWYVSIAGGSRGAQVSVYNEGIRMYSKAQLVGQNQVTHIKLGQLEYAALKPIDGRDAASVVVVSVSTQSRRA